MFFRAGQQEHLHYSMLFVVNDLNQLVGKLFLMDIMHGLAPDLLRGSKVEKFEGKEGDYLDLAPLYEKSTFAECGKNRDKPIKPLVHPIDFSFPADFMLLGMGLFTFVYYCPHGQTQLTPRGSTLCLASRQKV